MRKTFLLGAAALALVAAACGSSSGTSPTTAPTSTPTPGTTTAATGVPQGGTISMVTPQMLDPWGGDAYYGKNWQIEYLTLNCLVDPDPNPGDKTVPNLIPALATAIPAPSADGKSYTFTIRDGLKYSDGTAFQAQDVKDYMERALDPTQGYDGALGSGYYNGIVGMDKYAPANATKAGAPHIDGIVVSGSNVTFNLTAPDPDFVAKMALRFVCPQKPGGPHTRAMAPTASTGPYMATQADEKGLTLVRNPSWWDNAKIMGLDKYKGTLWNVDGYNLTVGDSADAILLKLKSDQVDMDWGADAVSSLAIRKQIEGDPTLSARFRADVAPFIRYYALNTKVPPFNNVKVRQAAEYAINRAALVAINGAGQPWSGLMPKGYFASPTDVYPSSPDMAKAKQLLTDAGVKLPVQINFLHGTVAPAPQLGAALKAQLEAVGFSVKVVTHARQGYYGFASDDKNGMNLIAAGWAPDWADGAAAMGPVLTAAAIGGQNLARFNDPAFESGFKTVDAMPYGPDRTTAWADLATKTQTDSAPLLTWLQEEELNLMSSRLGGFEYDPVHLVNMAPLYIKK